MTPKIIAHGGAWQWDDAQDAGKHAALAEAIAVGSAILNKGGSALDAVEQTVIMLENNPVLDAGTGGYLNQAGIVQLDALIIDGAQLDFGAVGGVSRVQNPITLARKVLEQTDFNFFVGAGADELAEKLGIDLIDNAQLITDAMRDFYHAQRTDGPKDTVGAVALDQNGNVAAATSTSGTPYKPVGRVGDSPLFGAGGYAANNIGTVGATGYGEQIMRSLLSKYACDQIAAGVPAQQAANAAIAYTAQLFADPMTGVIVIDHNGNIGAAHNTPKLAVGWVDTDGNIQTAMNAQALLD